MKYPILKSFQKKFAGKKIWLIGGSRGIGLELAKILIASGADLSLSSRNKPKEDIGKYQFYPLDVADLKTLKSVCNKFIKNNQTNLDGVIYMSGAHKQALIANLRLSDLDHIVKVNLHAPSLVAKWLTPYLQKRRGLFAICGSQTSFVGAPLGQPYSATKAYLKNFIESLAIECDQMFVHLIAPGFVRTAIVADISYHMPMAMDADQAAYLIAKGLMGKRQVIQFPYIFTFLPKIWVITPLIIKKLMWIMLKNKLIK